MKDDKFVEKLTINCKKEFDREKLMELLREVESKKMTAKEAAAILNISIDKYYRLKRQINKFGNTSAY